jgi:hypothetical protein
MSPTSSFSPTNTPFLSPTISATCTVSATITLSPTISPTFSPSPTPEWAKYGNFILAPNPARDGAKIRLFCNWQSYSVEWRVYNLAGELIYWVKKSGNEDMYWETSAMASGIYLVGTEMLMNKDDKEPREIFTKVVVIR